jgi:hypothetical protein
MPEGADAPCNDLTSTRCVTQSKGTLVVGARSPVQAR